MDPSEKVCIEYLRPKTVPDGLVALGTISFICDTEVRVQIAGGITCHVDRLEISQDYTNALKTYAGRRPSIVEQLAPARLPDLFKIGQRYVCKIVERRQRPGYTAAQDIMATFDPRQIQQDALPKTLLSIPNVPLQCSVTSIEDHGYQMDIGFEGLRGFLNFEETGEKRKRNSADHLFAVGQIVSCNLKEPISNSGDADTPIRVVQLAYGDEAQQAGKFSEERVNKNLLTARCIPPGSQGFLTVMKVRHDGLIVNFLNEFAGFVTKNHLKTRWQEPKEFKVSDKIKCHALYYNSVTETFALSLRSLKRVARDLEHFTKNHFVGQFIEDAKVAYVDSTKAVYFKIDNSSHKAVANVKDAFEQDVGTMAKDEIMAGLDSTFTENSSHQCRIKSINYADMIVVVSLKSEFMQLSHVSVDELKAGDLLESVEAKRYVKDGLVVSFGLNLRAIILNQHLQDYNATRYRKLYPLGKKIRCRVLKVDSEKIPPRVYLTNKAELVADDVTAITNYNRSLVGTIVPTIIFKVRQDGLVVEMFNNIKGFIPRIFLNSVPISNLDDLFKVGQVLPACVIYKADPVKRSLKLGLIAHDEIRKMKKDRQNSKKQRKKLKQLQLEHGQPMKKLKAELERPIIAKTSKGSSTNDSVSSASEDESLPDEDDEGGNEEGTKDAVDDDPEADGSEDDSGQQSSDESESDSESKRAFAVKHRPDPGAKRIIAKEARTREAEMKLMDTDRPPESISDFERLLLREPNSAKVWIRYSNYFLDNVETEKARIICRRALRTINFRLEAEKLKIWLQLVKIEAKFGGSERMWEIINEAALVMDKPKLFGEAARLLASNSCNELDEAQRLHLMRIKLDKSVEALYDHIEYLMERRLDPKNAREEFEKCLKLLPGPSERVLLKSKFGQLEFKCGEAERGKTIFAQLLCDNPRRKDLSQVYEAMLRKYCMSQV